MLNHHIEIYIPSCKRNGEIIPDELATPWLVKVVNTMTNLFGGCTAIHGVGTFINERNGEHINEKVCAVRSYMSTNDLNTYRYEIRCLCQEVCCCLAQKSVALVIDGEMSFIRPSV